ncbi:MAG: tetratricopeptide repeat protein [Bacteroidia bacterium]|nr:tetratricopeptide repeat protein [Bacteroidia bacterium]
MKQLTIVFLILISGIELMGQPENEGKSVSILDRYQADQLYREGMDLYNNNKLGQAKQKFISVQKLNPLHPEVYELLGEIYYLDGSYNEAYRYFEKASILKPNSAKLLNDMGVAAAENSAYLLAIEHFEEAIEIDPDYKDAVNNLNEARKRQGALANNNDLSLDIEDDNDGKSRPDESKFKNANSPEEDVDVVEKKGGKGPKVISRRNPGQEYDYSGSRLKTGKATDSYIDVVAVKITASRTIVTFKITNPIRQRFEYKLAPPGSKDAWVIVDSKGLRSYRLEGFLSLPEVARDRPIAMGYGSEYITAYFQRLSTDVFQFNILEGEDPIPGAWNFYMLTLSNIEDE